MHVNYGKKDMNYMYYKDKCSAKCKLINNDNILQGTFYHN